MNKVIIFKSDMIGDLINFSPCLKIIKDNNKDHHITLICSEYNYQIAKNYTQIDKLIIFKKKNIFINILKNFETLFLTKYNHLLQFDGKNSSFFISYFINSKIKSTICYIKHKKIFSIKYLVSRPSKFFLNIFYNNYIFCNEDYAQKDSGNNKVHYQTNYFNILKNINFKITDKRNLFTLDKSFENQYDIFYKNEINKKFCLFHFDEKWDRLKPSDYDNSLKIINKLSQKYKVIITTGIKNFIFLKDLNQRFYSFVFTENEFSSENKIDNNNIILLKNLPLNLLAYFIKNSELNLSFHSGPIVHISPTFDTEIIDFMPKSKNNELDRWIPSISKYRRINFEDLNDKTIENI